MFNILDAILILRLNNEWAFIKYGYLVLHYFKKLNKLLIRFRFYNKIFIILIKLEIANIYFCNINIIGKLNNPYINIKGI